MSQTFAAHCIYNIITFVRPHWNQVKLTVLKCINSFCNSVTWTN